MLASKVSGRWKPAGLACLSQAALISSSGGRTSKPLISPVSTQIGLMRISAIALEARKAASNRSVTTAASLNAGSAGMMAATAPARRHMVATPAGAPVA
ncbi:hypothetical protein ASD32_18515 [Rhizobium sp. Root483D2]|nr:hypothetical protein ASD32_18515 [Rhizobium sp. Root483D2]